MDSKLFASPKIGHPAQCLCSTPGDVQYTRGIASNTPGVFSTLGDSKMCVGDIMSTVGMFNTLGDTMISVGDIMSTRGMFSTMGFPYKFSCFPNDLPPTFIMISPGVLMISPQCTEHPQCTHDIPQCTEYHPLYCTPPVYCTDIMQGDGANRKMRIPSLRFELITWGSPFMPVQFPVHTIQFLEPIIAKI